MTWTTFSSELSRGHLADRICSLDHGASVDANIAQFGGLNEANGGRWINVVDNYASDGSRIEN